MKKVSIRKVFSICLCVGVMLMSAPTIAATSDPPFEDTTVQQPVVTQEVAVDNSDVVGTIESSDDSDTQSTDHEIGTIESVEALKDVATLDAEDIAKGAELASPVVKLLNTCVAVLVACLAAWILANSVIDLICLCVTPFQKRVLMLHTNPQQTPQDWMTKVASIASEQVIHALLIANGSNNANANAGGGMQSMGVGGSFGMPGGAGGYGGAFGMPGGMQQTQQQLPKPKATLPIYLRKRMVFLVMFGVCLVVFTCTAFTDLGIKIANFALGMLGNINIG